VRKLPSLYLFQLPRLLAKRRSSAWFGMAIIALVWIGIILRYWEDRNNDLLAAEQTGHSFSMVFEENVIRSIDELDNVLRYLRRDIEEHSLAADYGEILQRLVLPPDITVQSAIIDARGIMRASTAGPHPSPPIDLSDREHFQVHLHGTKDNLFISQPVIGRASGKWSVQLSRRFPREGKFMGVVVVSLDPEHFTNFYNRVDLRYSESIALIGEDGVVRAAGGPMKSLKLGEDIRNTKLIEKIRMGINSAFELPDPVTGQARLMTLRKVKGHPLWVLVSLSKDEIVADSFDELERAGIGGLILTIFILAAMEIMFRTEEGTRQKSRELKETLFAMARLASEDSLTGLLNRRGFQAALEKNTSSKYALFFIDIDRFKVINDTLGHRIGDLLLQGSAQRLQSSTRTNDVLARLGGDEFAVLVFDWETKGALEAYARRLLTEIREPFNLSGYRVQTSFTIGIALGPADAKSAHDLLSAADLALYAAKKSGPGSFQFYHCSMTEEMSERQQIEADLRDALSGNQLELYYQPIVSMRDNRIRGFEALARWKHPKRGDVSPSVFMPIAEDMGLMAPIGEWALMTACRQIARLPRDVRVSVNLSPAQFSNCDLVKTVEGALQTSGLEPHRLELEITERLLLDNTTHTAWVIKQLRSLGVSIALDDFGAGYSSLSYLRKFPLQKLKIDRSFISDIGMQGEQIAIIQGIISIARALGMSVTAEGVESDKQQEILKALQCDEAQGFLFGKPMAFDEIIAMVRGGKVRRVQAA
jgi:diguanylate cyclase (GGDEF)-like protein